MRALVIASALLFFSLAVLVPSTAEARTVACTDLRSTTSCPGLVCVDSNNDGRITYDDACIIIYCLDACCVGADMCPPPYY